MSRVGGLLALLMLLGCHEPRLASAACTALSARPTGTEEHGGRAFTIQLPATFQAQTAVSIDSEVGRWGTESAHVSYDYGPYSDDLMSGTPPRDRHRCDGEIGGRRAWVVMGRSEEGHYVAAAHWPDLGPGAGSRDRTSLTVIGVAADSIGRQELLASLWTVRFRE